MIYPANPKMAYLSHKQEIDIAIERVLSSGRYILGEEVRNFEVEFSRYLNARFAVGVASGTDALMLAIKACGIGVGDYIITVSHTAVATIAAIELAGGIPLLVDIDPKTYCIDPDKLHDLVKRVKNGRMPISFEKLKAVIPVHLYGHPADLLSIQAICHEYGLLLIEDCSQSHGASVNGRMTGTWGDASTFSFYPTKNLGAIGDGGAVVTNNQDVATTLALLREYGWKEKYVSGLQGHNSRLDEIQAAILRVKLQYLDMDNNRRRELADLFAHHIDRFRIELPKEQEYAKHVYHQYVIRTDLRNELKTKLNRLGIETLVHYPVPVHMQPAYRDRLFCSGMLENTCSAVEEILSLPIYPELNNDDAVMIAESINKTMTDH